MVTGYEAHYYRHIERIMLALERQTAMQEVQTLIALGRMELAVERWTEYKKNGR